MGALVELRNVSYKYPGSSGWALIGITLELGKGLSIVTGPTGSGKSTLLRVISGAVPKIYGGILKGYVRVEGKPVLVPQEFDSFIIMPTVREDLEYAAEAGGASPWEAVRVARRAAEALGIEDLLERSVASLSTGERQRVAIAAALAMGATMILLDEPLAHQDEVGVSLVRESIEKLGFEAVIVAEHRISLVAGLASKIVVMDGGRIVVEGAPRDVLGYASKLMDPLGAIGDRLENCRARCLED